MNSGLGPMDAVPMDSDLKQRIHDHWNQEPCGTKFTDAVKLTRAYFDEIESVRYRREPEIFSFAQFTLFHGHRVLEVGVGAGSDFTQWVRAGAIAHGIDLTEASIQHVTHRLGLYSLKAEEVQVADAENIPYPDEFFDLVYSWGVIHHSPNTIKALEEIIRKTRIGGRIKIMIYNKFSLVVYYKWLYYCLLRGKPFRSLDWVLYHHQESLGTKGYSTFEIAELLSRYPVRVTEIVARATHYDLLKDYSLPMRFMASSLATLLGRDRCGLYLTMDMVKTGAF